MEKAILKQQQIPFVSDISEKERFIRNYGAFNCKYLWLKESEEVFAALKAAYPDEPELSEKASLFIKANGGKRVLAYCHAIRFSTDVFLFGEDDIPFTEECFATQ